MSTVCQRFRSKSFKIVPIAAFSVLMVFATRGALAAWPGSGLPIATGPARQWEPVGITAPGGDLQVFWSEIVTSNTLRAQRVTLQGTIATGWPAGGRALVQTPASITRPELAGDGAGGHLLAWYDYRNSGGPRGIYGVRVDAEAAVMPGWSTSGTPICTSVGVLDQLIKMCPDGDGGAFVAWTDSRNTPPMSTLIYDVFAQHVLANGTLDPAWPAAGLGLTTGSGYKYPHAMVADGSGGFWLMSESSGATEKIAVTHRQSDGSLIGTWETPSYASRVSGVSDGSGGVFLTWEDCRDCLTLGVDAVYVMRLGPGAQPRPGWPAGGIQIAASTRSHRLPAITTTQGDAVVIAWLETGGTPDDEFKAQRVEANGAVSPGWPAGGTPFAIDDFLDGWPLIAPDGAGGALFAFQNGGLFGSAVTSSGAVPAAFPDTGLSLCSVDSPKTLWSLVPDGLNGAYALWEDRREGLTNVDVYAMRFTRDGIVGGPTGVDPSPSPASSPGVALSRPAPNPTFTNVFLRLSIAAHSRVRVEAFDLSGRSVSTLLDADVPAGPIDLKWDGNDRDGRPTPPGIYLMRARTANSEAVQRIVRLK